MRKHIRTSALLIGCSLFAVSAIHAQDGSVFRMNLEAPILFGEGAQTSLVVVVPEGLRMVAGSPFDAQIDSTGGQGSVAFSLDNEPAWLSISSTGRLMGTPPAAGTATFDIIVTSAGRTVSRTVSLTIAAAARTLAIGVTGPERATSGEAFSQTFSVADADGAVAFSSPDLPADLHLTPEGVLSGTPLSHGVRSFQIRVVDAAQNTGTHAHSLTVMPILGAIASTDVPASATVGAAVSFTATASGEAGVSNAAWTTSPEQAWLSVSRNGTTATLSGNAPAEGNHAFAIVGHDIHGREIRSPQYTISTVAPISATYSIPNPTFPRHTIPAPMAAGPIAYTYSTDMPASLGTINATTGSITISATAPTALHGPYNVTITHPTTGAGHIISTGTINVRPAALPVFTAEPNAMPSVVHESNIALLEGGYPISVSINTANSSQYRICRDATCTNVVYNWGISARSLTATRDQLYVQLRTTFPAAGSSSSVAFTAAGQTATWSLSRNPCINAGAICSDGTKYAGTYSGKRLYVTGNARDDGNVLYRWRTGGGLVGLSGTSGEANTTTLALDSKNQMAVICNNLEHGGHSDWYLPSKEELAVILVNRAALGYPSGNGYYSSSERDAAYAWYIGNDSVVGPGFKSDGGYFVCARD